MKKLITYFCLSLFCSYNLQSQELDHLWNIVAGDGEGGSNRCYSVATDKSGNLFAAGLFNGLIDFDQGPGETLLSASYANEGYLVKFDSTGKLLWANLIESTRRAQIAEICVDNSGNVLVVGQFWKSVSLLSPTDTITFLNDEKSNWIGFVAKYSSSGNLTWAKKLNSTDESQITSVTTDSKNNVILGGYFSDTLNIEPGPNGKLVAKSFDDMLLAKFDSLGNYEWAFSIGATINDQTQKVRTDSQDNVIVAGFLSSSKADFDPSSPVVNLKTFGSRDVFLAKYSPIGKYTWAQIIGGSLRDDVFGMEVSKSGHIYVAGTFNGKANFNTTGAKVELTSVKLEDAYLAKYTPQGKNTWAIGLGSVDEELLNDLAIDASGNCYLTGSFSKPLDFDPSSNDATITPNGDNLFVASYDSLGQYNWAFNLGPNGETQTICTDSFQNLWIGGGFSYKVDFDPAPGTANLGSLSGKSINSFFARYKQTNHTYDTAWTVSGRESEGSSDGIYGLDRDKNGNVIGTGSFAGKMDLGPNGITKLEANGREDGFVVKYDSLGNYLWGFALSSPGLVRGFEVACDKSNNFYITGWFWDSLDLDPSSKTAKIYGGANVNMFLAKYDQNGNFLWGYGWESAQGSGLSIDKTQNIWVTGSFGGTVDFNPGTGKEEYKAISADAFLMKFDPSGNFSFAKQVGGNGIIAGSELVNGHDNCVYLGGTFRNGCDFDPSTNTAILTATNTLDPYIAKYDSMGNYLWVRGFLGKGQDYLEGMDLDNNENVYISGSFQDTIDFGGSSTLICNGKQDAYVASYDSSGNYRWAHGFGGIRSTNFNVALDVAIKNDIVNVTGYFRDTVDFNPSLSNDSTLISKLFSDIFILKLDTSAKFIKVAHLPSAFSAWAYRIVTFGSKVFIGGLFQKDIDFDPDPKKEVLIKTKGSPSGDSDLFIALYGKYCKPSSSVLSITACGPYEAPSGRRYFLTSGTFMDTVTNAEGCDSVITINLTLNNQVRVISTTVCESYLAPSGKIYRNSGDYLDTVAISSSCDSVVFIKLKVSNSTTYSDVTSCDSVLSPEGKRYLSKTGTYVDSLKNRDNCDSLVVTNFTRLEPSFAAISPTACKAYDAPSGSTTYTQSGVYKDTLVNALGCDSIITINLTLLEPITSSIKASACGSYKSPSGRHTYTSSGTYSDTIPSFQACDSVITIELEIIKLNASVSVSQDTLTADSSGLTYKWLDCQNNFAPISFATQRKFRPSKSGEYAVEISQKNCSDTSTCYKVEIIGMAELDKEDIGLYPSPSSSFIVIQSQKMQLLNVKVYSATGQLVVVKETNEGQRVQLSTTALPTGLYSAVIETDSGLIHKIFVKE